MAIVQKTVSLLLIATFVLGNSLCQCKASAAVESAGAERHAHHTIQAETGSARACSHVDCSGSCAALSSINASDPTVATGPRSYEPDEAVVVTRILADPILMGGSLTYSFVLHAPPVPDRTTPISRFDRILA